MSPGDERPPRPARAFLLRSLTAALVIALLTAGASATAALLTIDEILPPEDPGRGTIIEVDNEPTESGKPQTILLLGSDRRWQDERGDRVRSDTMMLVRLDPRQGATTVLSIPRDLMVEVPGYGTRKINDAYAYGGPKLAVRTLRQLTGLRIHHVVNVNFGGFREAINLFDCFYVDVDRRYYHSNVGVPEHLRYDAIDIHPGYQRLCGIDALDYVRHRHSDSDLARAARQQDFLRAAKNQISTSRLIDDLKKLGEITSRATQTDRELRTKKGFMRIAKLALSAADDPVRQIEFPAEFVTEGEGETRIDYVRSTPGQIEQAVDRFLEGGGEAAEPKVRSSSSGSSGSSGPSLPRGSVRRAGLVEARAPAQALVDGTRRAGGDWLGFPLRFPSHITPDGTYDDLRLYKIDDRAGVEHRAFRFVIAKNRIEGQFYGVQGMSWRNPPLLAHPSAVRRIKGRRLELFRAGSRLRFVAWRTDSAVYWVSNTLNLKLTDDEMLAMAAALTTPGS